LSKIIAPPLEPKTAAGARPRASRRPAASSACSSIDVYGEVLGLTEVPKPPDLAKRGGAWFERGDVRVHLGVEKNFRPARKAHIGFLVDDIATIIAECRRRGLEIVDDEPLDGFERIYVYDPFGNRLELMQPTS
jgi:catechol 2,3-dioxygenase-like lactoylglutathione lyase family enzyme